MTTLTFSNIAARTIVTSALNGCILKKIRDDRHLRRLPLASLIEGQEPCQAPRKGPGKDRFILRVIKAADKVGAT